MYVGRYVRMCVHLHTYTCAHMRVYASTLVRDTYVSVTYTFDVCISIGDLTSKIKFVVTGIGTNNTRCLGRVGIMH